MKWSSYVPLILFVWSSAPTDVMMYGDFSTDYWRKVNLESNFHFHWMWKLSIWLWQNVENVNLVNPWSLPNYKLFCLAFMFEAARQQCNNVCQLLHWPSKEGKFWKQLLFPLNVQTVNLAVAECGECELGKSLVPAKFQIVPPGLYVWSGAPTTQ